MYLLILVQKGRGCDYTIGCGRRFVELKALSDEEAILECRKILIGEPDDNLTCGYSNNGEHPLAFGEGNKCDIKDAVLYKFSDKTVLPINPWFEEAKSTLNKIKQLAHLNKEKAEHERLKSKFQD